MQVQQPLETTGIKLNVYLHVIPNKNTNTLIYLRIYKSYFNIHPTQHHPFQVDFN